MSAHKPHRRRRRRRQRGIPASRDLGFHPALSHVSVFVGRRLLPDARIRLPTSLRTSLRAVVRQGFPCLSDRPPDPSIAAAVAVSHPPENAFRRPACLARSFTVRSFRRRLNENPRCVCAVPSVGSLSPRL